MNFTEKMQVWSLVLDYLKVVLGYPVTIPVLILALCILFRERIRAVLDALQELTFPGGSMLLRPRVKLRERKEVQQFQTDIKVEMEAATEYTTLRLQPQPAGKVADAIASFFGLAASALPLIPKAERRKYIIESTGTLPNEFKRFREALLLLADQAPEVHALNARDVIVSSGTPVTGTVRIGVEERADVKIPPAPRV